MRERLTAALTRWQVYLPALVVLLGAMFFASTAGQPLHLDNMDFPAAAKATALTGRPVYYRGEYDLAYHGNYELAYRPGGAQRLEQMHVALYHPPLYTVMLAVWMVVFGTGEVQTRMFGLVCLLLQGALALGLLSTLCGRQAIRHLPLFWALLLISPYALQAASITDIDSTIYGPLLTGVLWSAVALCWRDGEWREDRLHWTEVALLTTLLTLSFWAKLTTVLAVLPGLVLLLRPRLGWRRAAGLTAAVTATAVVLFLTSYWAFCALLGLDFAFAFQFTLQSFLNRGASGRPGLAGRLADRKDHLVQMVPYIIAWAGFVPWIAAVAAWLALAGQAWKTAGQRLYSLSVVLGVALFCTLFYCSQQTSFGFAPYKYVLVFWGLIIGVPLMAWPERFRPAPLTGAVGLSAVAAPALLGVAVSRTIRDTFLMRGELIWPAAWWYVLPAALLLAGLSRRVRWGGRLLNAGLALHLGLAFGTCLHQARVPYSTTYDYGQIGLEDAAGYVRAHTRPDEVIVSMKDVGYRAERRFVESYGALYGDTAVEQRVRATIATGRAKFAVFTVDRGQDQLEVKPDLMRFVQEQCELVASPGHYRIYRVKSYRSPRN